MARVRAGGEKDEDEDMALIAGTLVLKAGVDGR